MSNICEPTRNTTRHSTQQANRNSTRQRLFRYVTACGFALLLIGCRPAVEQTASVPQTTDTASTDTASDEGSDEATQQDASATPEQASSASADVAGDNETHEQIIYFGTTADLTIEMPAEWEATTMGADVLRDRLAGAGEKADSLLNATDDATTMIAAQYNGPVENPAFRPEMMVVQMPRHDLTLEQYVEGLAGTLSAGEGVEVVRAGLLNDVRLDGAPVAMVAYEMPQSENQPALSGYQIAQLDESGENLVVITWVALEDDMYSMLPDFHAMAASVTEQTD